jgi:hypothetical protein
MTFCFDFFDSLQIRAANRDLDGPAYARLLVQWNGLVPICRI